jgi:hypothetical protein
MLRATSSAALTLSACALTLGCAGSPDLAPGERIDDAAKADGASPVRGFYFSQGGQLGDLASLTLGDGSDYERAYRMVDCVPQQVCEPQRGRFALTEGSGHQYIRFNTEDGAALDRYEYVTDGKGGIELRKDGGSHWFSMQKDEIAGVKFDLETENADTANLTDQERAALPSAVVDAAQALRPLDSSPTDEGPLTRRLTYQGDTFYTVSQYIEAEDLMHGFVFDSKGALVASADWDSANGGWAFEDPMQTPGEVAARNATP